MSLLSSSSSSKSNQNHQISFVLYRKPSTSLNTSRPSQKSRRQTRESSNLESTKVPSRYVDNPSNSIKTLQHHTEFHDRKKNINDKDTSTDIRRTLKSTPSLAIPDTIFNHRSEGLLIIATPQRCQSQPLFHLPRQLPQFASRVLLLKRNTNVSSVTELSAGASIEVDMKGHVSHPLICTIPLF